MNNTKAMRDRQTFSAVAAAIRHVITGEIVLGGDHFDARVKAYKIKTGSRRPYGEIINEDRLFDVFLQDENYENGFINCIGEWLSRQKATQLAKLKNTNITEVHAWTVLSIEDEN